MIEKIKMSYKKMLSISKRMLRRGYRKLGIEFDEKMLKTKSKEMTLCVTRMIHERFPDIGKDEFENVINTLYNACDEEYFINLFG